MPKTQNTGIRTHGFTLSGAAAFYLAVIYFGAMWGMLIVLLPLVHFFPTLKEIDWLITMPSILVAVILLLHMLCCFCVVILEPDTVVVKWFGIVVRRIPASKFKTFCAVGNQREDVLCLSGYSVEEMAQMQEKRLLRSFLHKHDVPFRKRKADWQDDFAREFLNHQRKNPFSIFIERDVVMFEMHPALQYSIRQMYPQLPYKNYTGVISQYVSRFSIFSENRAVCFQLQTCEYEVRMELDGIHICTKKEEISFIPAQQIKTVVRVDIFKGYEKCWPHHIPLLFVTSASEEDMAKQSASRGYCGICLNDTANQKLASMMAATYLALHWNIKKKDCCVVYHTEKNLNTLRTLYPHIQINDIAASWLISSDDPPQ